MFEDLLRRLLMDVSRLANELRSVFESEVVRGALVSAVMPSGSITVVVRHGLGRAAVAAAVVSASAAGAFTVDPVTAVDSVTVRASVAPGANVALLLWVF